MKIEREWQMENEKSNRQEQITQRLRDIPREAYRRIYEKAVEGLSRKAAIHAFCLECTCWQKEEVRKCTALACPLYALRPYQERSNHSDNRLSSAPESKKSSGGGINIAYFFKLTRFGAKALEIMAF